MQYIVSGDDKRNHMKSLMIYIYTQLNCVCNDSNLHIYLSVQQHLDIVVVSGNVISLLTRLVYVN